MKRFSFLFLLIAFLIFTGCSNDDPKLDQPVPDNPKDPEYVVDYDIMHDSSPDYDLTYQYKEGVLVLNEVAQQYLISVEADTILYFSNNTPSNILPEVGTVISSKVSDKTPYGMGNKVLSVSEENGHVKCVTTTASFNEIFNKLELTSSIQLASMASNEYRTKTRAELGRLDLIKIPIKQMGTNGFFAEMNLELGGIFTFNIDLTAQTYEVSLTTGIALKGEMGVRYVVEEDDEELKNLIQILPKLNIFTGFVPIAGGVIVLRPYADIEMALKGALSGKITLDINKSYIFKAGWNENGFFTEDLSENDTDFFNNLNIEGKFKFGPAADVNFGLGLWTKNIGAELTIEPMISLGGELGLNYDDEGKCEIGKQELSVVGDIDVSGKLFISIFDWVKKIPAHFTNIPLFNYNIPIFPGAPQLRTMIYSENPLKVRWDFRMDANSLIKFLAGTPSLYVFKGENVIAMLEGKTSSGTIVSSSGETKFYEFTFEMPQALELNTEYTLIPGLKLGGILYYWKEYSFKHYDKSAPTLRFKDVEIKSAYHNDDSNLYIYNVDINIDLENVEGLFELRLDYSYTENGVTKTENIVSLFSPNISKEYHNGLNTINKTFNFFSPNIKGKFIPELRPVSSTVEDPVYSDYDFNFIYQGNLNLE